MGMRGSARGGGLVFALLAASAAPVPVRGAPAPAPAAPPPVSLTASDGTGLRVVSFQAQVVVQDPLAFTELHLVFSNDQARAIEGQFAITLPPGAAVSRFAMRQQWGWQEGEVVERQAARVAYESFLHRRVDPALLEKQAGNEFRARVFPIAASSQKEIIVSYSQDLAQARDPYRLTLRGLPRLDALDVRVLVGKRSSRPAGTSLGGTLHSEDVIEVHEHAFQPDRDLEVPLQPGDGGLRQGNLAVARITPLADAAPDRPADLLVLVDSSASRALGFRAQVDRLGALLRKLAADLGAELPLRVACFDQEVAEIFAGKLGGFGARETRAILDRRALGASDLGAALAWAAALDDRRWSRVLVLTDGVATAGATTGAELRAKVAALATAGAQRLDVLAVGGIRDHLALRALAAGGLPRDGAVLDEGASAEEASRRLASATVSGIKVSVPGAGWVWPERLDGIQPGDQALIYADLPAERPLEVVLQGARTQKQTVPTAEASRPLLERGWVAARIERLLHQRETTGAGDADLRAALRKQIVEISIRHRVLSDFTALLVLDTEQDYARFNIDRRALTDILVVGPRGVDVLRRGELAPGAFAQGPRSGAPDDDDFARRGQADEGPARRGPMTNRPVGVPGDRDGDRIPDAVDRCPSEPETYNGFDDDDGCPDKGRVIVHRGRIEILDRIYFTSNQADIKAISFPLLDAIAATIKGNPQLALLEVQGHVDSREKESLGVARAAAVMKALVDRGVHAERLVAMSFGRQRPMCTKASEDCRSQNRRVEFRIARRTDEIPEVASRDSTRATPAPRVKGEATAAGEASEAERRFAEHKTLLEAGKTAQALKAALAWRDERPGEILALLALGEALEASGSRARAARAYGSLIDLFPSHADYRRLAGQRLEGLGGGALALAIDSYRQARAQRPDHPASHRLLAYALARAGQPAAALDVILEGLARTYPVGRFAGVDRVLRDDAGLLAAALVRSEPARRDQVLERLKGAEVKLASERSLRFVVTWENDTTDVDLYVRDGKGNTAWYGSPRLGSGGALYADVTTGYGPECFAILGTPAAYPYRLEVQYFSRGAMGYGLGKLEVIEHDGAGGLRFDDRPFALLDAKGSVSLGSLRGPITPTRTASR
jgi:outer membrane protein OmpA-like peptidoglycan-associated protein